MKNWIIITGIAVATVMASCTKSEEVRPEEEKVFSGDKAYVVVSISDVGTSGGTRATSGGFEYGKSEEYAVNDAHFYFYSATGVFVTESDEWNGNGTETTDNSTNIDFASKTILTLHGLTDKSYPKWVVTVLNAPEGFAAPEHLDDFYRLLASESDEGYTVEVGGTTYFTMSTSSYVDSDNGYPAVDANGDPATPAYWFATPVSDSNFSLEPLSEDLGTAGDESTVVPIVIYVERLAAKVFLSASLGNETDGSGRYKVTAETTDGNEIASDEPYYVSLDGWTLNATARQSNIVKTVRSTDTWNDAYFYPSTYVTSTDYTFGTEWNDATDHRSYWGESYNYGYGSALGTSGGKDDEYEDGTGLDPYLRYTSLDGDDVTLKSLGTSEWAYCAENTNTAGKPNSGYRITTKNSSYITSVLVKATLYDGEGTRCGTLVRCDGLLYTEANYLAYALEHLDFVTDEEKLTGWCVAETDAGSGETTYTLIDESYLALVDDYDGNVHVAVAEDHEGDDFYYLTAGVPDAGTHSYSNINDDLNTLFNNVFGTDANGFRDGEMYYSIPIEHLNGDYGQTYKDDQDKDRQLVLEGNYGVVRNHIYYLTITKLEGLGRGVYTPGEVIVPQEDQDLYSLTAQVNVLSWKVVSQDVEL